MSYSSGGVCFDFGVCFRPFSDWEEHLDDELRCFNDGVDGLTFLYDADKPKAIVAIRKESDGKRHRKYLKVGDGADIDAAKTFAKSFIHNEDEPCKQEESVTSEPGESEPEACDEAKLDAPDQVPAAASPEAWPDRQMDEPELPVPPPEPDLVKQFGNLACLFKSRCGALA